ncbi:BTAD domain-containing putative transcriptional regulator [Streptomyces sp. NPDC058690]|uniref:AfsR/SARP family transcriptional regulator n=1 Tax=Streptomyces sp. NPDC058690 TaxID=3346600 RepID=UPI00365134CC
MVTDLEGQLRFNVLGTLEGWVGGQRIRLGGMIQERVLATLLLGTGRVLPVPRLVAAAWAEEPPATAAHQVRKAIADLRQRIPRGSQVLVTDGPGYRAALTDSQLDLTEFNALVSGARQATAAGRTADAVSTFSDALALWRGPVLSGAGGPVIEAAATALEERRLAAAEQLFALRLTLGEAAELVVDLREIVSAYPLRETLRGQLMLALYRSGRQAEALEEFGRVRDLLVEELGIDPGAQLTKLHEGILRENPELAAPEPEPSTPTAAPAPAPSPAPAAVDSPCTLPYDTPDFSGRDRELGRIIDRAQGTGTRIIAIDGMGGSGKTSLAVRAAHCLAREYPTGQLYIDLRGYSPDQTPVSSTSALNTMLRTLGLPGDRIPDDIAGRTALWRKTVTGKRMLILLDNASNASDIHSLLPTGTDCLVLVTSRARLVDLDGAEWISLSVMTPEESIALITETLGVQRVAAEPEAAGELAQLCGRLPLALRIATARLCNRPRWNLQYMTDRLRDETRRLDELSLGERSVAANLRLSYQALDEDSRTAFRLLSLHPGGTMDVYAAAALLGSTPRHAEDVLELLLDDHLVQQPEIGLYTFHDLVRSFARALHAGTTEEASETARERLLGYYLEATEAACTTLFPGRRKLQTGISGPAFAQPNVQDPDLARAWFAREQTALLPAVTLAVRHKHDRHAVFLARNVAFYLNAHGHLNDFEEVCRSAVTAARRLGDDALLGLSLANLGVAYWKIGNFTEGIEAAQEGRDVAARLGDHGTEAHSNSTLGLYQSLLGRFPEALEHLRIAIAQESELGLSRAEAESLTILSTLYEQWGRHREAADAARRAVELCRQLGQHENELEALIDLAFAQVGLGQYGEADALMARVRQLCNDTREPGTVALAMALSADIAYRLGREDQSAEYARRAIDHADPSASPLRRAKVENMIGRLLHKRGEHASAGVLHTQAYERAASMNYRPEKAYALLGMSQAADALGDHRTAARQRAECEKLFEAMGVPADCRRT